MAQAEYDRLKQLTQSNQGEQTHLQESLQQFQERLRGGETTGDRIRDHVVAWHGINESLEQRLHQLEDNLTNHPGEFVLMASQHWERENIIEELYVGIVTPPFLELHPGYAIDLGIVTPKHAIINSYPRRDGVRTREDSIRGFETSLIFLDRPLSRKNPGGALGAATFQVIVGDEAVYKWFLDRSKKNMAYEYWSMERGYDDFLTRSQEERLRDVDILVLYERAQRALEKPSNLPPSVQKVVHNEIQKRKFAILENIEELVGKEEELIARLAGIRGIRLPRITLGLDDPSYERQVREDEEDLRIVRSIPVTEGRRRVQAQIRQEIEKAFEMGMHRDPWVVVNESQPGRKVETNVPQLIRGYCEYYEIPIPKD